MMSEPLILHRRSQNLIAARLGPGVFATRLTKEGVRLAREMELKVVPECSFTVRFFRKRRDLWDLLAPEAFDIISGS